MIDTINIYKSIRERLEAYFPDVNCQIKDVKNVIAGQPCFYIKFVAEKTNLNNLAYERNVSSFDVIYFSGEKTSLDLLSKKRILKTLFKKPLNVEEVWVEIESIDFNLNEDDYILNCTLDFDFVQQIENVTDDTTGNDVVNYTNTRYEGDYYNDEMMDELTINGDEQKE
jgi:hypothetical protein